MEAVEKYSKRSGELKTREPSPESRQVVDLDAYFAEYEALVARLEDKIERGSGPGARPKRCGSHTDECCFRYFELGLIEAAYLHNRVNRLLRSDVRSDVIRRAIEVSAAIRDMEKTTGERCDAGGGDTRALQNEFARRRLRCPLSVDRHCLLYDNRPLSCRRFNVTVDRHLQCSLAGELRSLSRNAFHSFTGNMQASGELSFPMVDAVSGRFVQCCFRHLAAPPPGGTGAGSG